MAFSITKGAEGICPPYGTLCFVLDAKNTLLIIMDLRLPRVIASALVGAALAVAGAVVQGHSLNL